MLSIICDQAPLILDELNEAYESNAKYKRAWEEFVKVNNMVESDSADERLIGIARGLKTTLNNIARRHGLEGE